MIITILEQLNRNKRANHTAGRELSELLELQQFRKGKKMVRISSHHAGVIYDLN